MRPSALLRFPEVHRNAAVTATVAGDEARSLGDEPTLQSEFSNSVKLLASKETHRLKRDNNRLSTPSAFRKWPLGERESEIPRRAERPKFLMFDPDSCRESLRNFSGAGQVSGHFLPATPFSSILGLPKWTPDDERSIQSTSIGSLERRSGNSPRVRRSEGGLSENNFTPLGVLNSTPEFQPRATSRIIMTVKPPMAPRVARSVWPWRCDSGMSSSTTT